MAKEVISARLHSDLVSRIEDIAREEKVDKTTILDRALEQYIREWRTRKAVESYRNGSVTTSKAAEIAGLSIWEMINVFSEQKITSQYTEQDLEDDLKAFQNE